MAREPGTGEGIMRVAKDISNSNPTDTPCACLETGPRYPDVDRHHVGVDETEGRFADVTIERCTRCGQRWLRYQLEYEAFTKSGRWAEAPITEEEATTMTPVAAAGYLDAAAWHIYGGSFWGHAGKRGSGRLP
jgi:hypothetical protein